MSQRHLELALRRQTLEFGTDHPLLIHDEDPRFRSKLPFLHRGRERLWRARLPNLLVDEHDSIAIGRDQRPHDIHDRSADPAGAVLWRREHDHLRLALPDRVHDTGLMQPGIWRFTRIDLA